MLEGLFGNIIVEKIFFSLFVYEEVYALGLKEEINALVAKAFEFVPDDGKIAYYR